MGEHLFGLLRNHLQLFAFVVAVYAAFSLYACAFLIWICAFLSKWWPLAVAYACFCAYDKNTPGYGGRTIQFARKLTMWKRLCSYYPVRLVKTAYLDRSKNYIFACHPCSMLTPATFGNFASDGNYFSKLYPGIIPHVLTRKAMFQLPLIREFYMALGMCEASKDSALHITQSMGGGHSPVVLVGGSGVRLSDDGMSYAINIKQRKAFVRAALLTGAQLVPVFTFGESDLCETTVISADTRWKRLKNKAVRWITLSRLFYWLRKTLNVALPFFKREITTVVGSPITVIKHRNPQKADVDRLYLAYGRKLKELFDKYRTTYSKYPDAKLEIL